MTLRARFALSLLTIFVVLLVPLAIALHALRSSNAAVRGLRDREFAASLILGSLRDGINDVRASEQRVAIVRDRAGLDSLARAIGRAEALADSLRPLTPPGIAAGLGQAIAETRTFAQREAAAALAGRLAEADSIASTHVLPAVARAEQGIGRAEREIRQTTRERVASVASSIARAYVVSAAVLAVALVLAIGVALWLARSISRPVQALERGMSAVADGDFTPRIALDPTRPDEFGRLAGAFLEMTRQLAELDKLKAEFVSIASHELKTPINVVNGYIQLLDEGVYGELAPKQREVLRTLHTQTQSLNRLVKQLLDVSRFEAGGSKLEPRPLRLAQLLDEMEQAFQVLAIQREIRFLVHRADGLPEEVVWDEDRMSEVLGNLLSNAFKFTSRGGRVELTVDAVDDAVAIEVRDTGHGIRPEQLPHIFEKFYQADNQHAGSRGGTGLGLAIAKGIVDAHHGTIGVESTPGVGTTFRLTLPTRVTSSPRRSAPARAATSTV